MANVTTEPTNPKSEQDFIQNFERFAHRMGLYPHEAAPTVIAFIEKNMSDKPLATELTEYLNGAYVISEPTKNAETSCSYCNCARFTAFNAFMKPLFFCDAKIAYIKTTECLVTLQLHASKALMASRCIGTPIRSGNLRPQEGKCITIHLREYNNLGGAIVQNGLSACYATIIELAKGACERLKINREELTSQFHAECVNVASNDPNHSQQMAATYNFFMNEGPYQFFFFFDEYYYRELKKWLSEKAGLRYSKTAPVDQEVLLVGYDFSQAATLRSTVDSLLPCMARA